MSQWEYSSAYELEFVSAYSLGSLSESPSAYSLGSALESLLESALVSLWA